MQPATTSSCVYTPDLHLPILKYTCGSFQLIKCWAVYGFWLLSPKERLWDLAPPMILQNHHFSSLPSPFVCRTGFWVTYSSGKFKHRIWAGATASDGSTATGRQGCWIIQYLTMRAREPAGNAKDASSSLPCWISSYPSINNSCHFLLHITPRASAWR